MLSGSMETCTKEWWYKVRLQKEIQYYAQSHFFDRMAVLCCLG